MFVRNDCRENNQLVSLLISQNMELRGEEFIAKSTLRELCDNVYL